METTLQDTILDIDFLEGKGFERKGFEPGYFIEYVHPHKGFAVTFLYQTNEVSIERLGPAGEYGVDYVVHRFKLLESSDLSFLVSRLTLLNRGYYKTS